jgi:SAM-dependent methyltransferase
MTPIPFRHCPCCISEDLIEIGKLPDSNWFSGTRLPLTLDGGSLYRCQYCGLKFRYPALSPQKYSQLYDNAVTSNWTGTSVRTDWDLISTYVGEHIPDGATVLDFGCYTGRLLSALGSRLRRYGIEVNRDAADIASDEIANPVWSSIDEINGGLKFDAIIAADVIEHVTEPLMLIKDLSSRLSEKGVLIITTGDGDNRIWNRFGANWWYCFYPEHIIFASRRWLDYVASVTQLSVERCSTFRYLTLPLPRRIMDTMHIYFYGTFPKLFLRLVNFFRRMQGRAETASIPGAGLTEDHLFVVLRNTEKN